MSLSFEWDAQKARTNERKHGVSFDEAATAFGILSRSRFRIRTTRTTRVDAFSSGQHTLAGSWLWSTPIAATMSASSAPGGQPRLKGVRMNTENNDSDDMREEYDFSDGVRGKYAARFAEGSNVVVLDPDVADLFTDSKSVNEALRALAEIAAKQSRKATG